MSRTALVKDAHLPRKIMHLLSASIIPALYYLTVVPDATAIMLVTGATVVWIMVEAWRLRHPSFNALFITSFHWLMKAKEAHSFTGVSYLLGGSALAMILFAKPIAVVSLFFIALGDPIAAMVGKRFGRIRMPNGKSVEGSVAMFVVCLLVGFSLAPSLSAPVIIAGGAMATMSEFFAGKIDDNLIAPVFSGAIMAVMSV